MRLWKSIVTATHMGWPSSSGRKPHTLTFMALVPGSDARPAKKKGCSVKLYDFQHRPSSVENLGTGSLQQEREGSWCKGEKKYKVYTKISTQYLMVLTCPSRWASTATIRPPESSML